MLIAYLRKNDGSLLVIVPILLILGVVTCGLLNAVGPEMSLAHFLNELFNWRSYEELYWTNMTLSAIMAFFTFMVLNRMTQTLGLMSKLSNMPLFAMAVLFFILPSELNTPFFWLCILVFVIYIKQCIAIISNVDVSVSVVNASFLIGVMTLIHPFFFVQYLSLIAAIFMSGSADLRNLLLSVIGAFLPFYFLGSVFYIFLPDVLPGFYALFQINLTDINTSDLPLTMGFVAIVVIAILINNSRILSSTTLRERRKWQFEVILFFVALLAGFLGHLGYAVAAAMVPAGIILSRTLTNHPKRWVTESLFLALIALIAINLLL